MLQERKHGLRSPVSIPALSCIAQMIRSKLSTSPSLSFLSCEMGTGGPNLSIHSSEAKHGKAQCLRMADTQLILASCTC